jgi:hypothetical protein
MPPVQEETGNLARANEDEARGSAVSVGVSAEPDSWRAGSVGQAVLEAEKAAEAQLLKVGAGEYCTPRHPTHFGPSSLEFHDNL